MRNVEANIQFYNAPELIDAVEQSPQAITNSHLNSLNTRFLKVFEENSPKPANGKQVDDRIKVFTDGGAPFSPAKRDVLPQFQSQLQDVVWAGCNEYFDEAGAFVDEESESKFFAIMDLSPQIARAITGKDSHISMVQQNHALHIVEAAMRVVKNPQDPIVIKVGIGGSDDEVTNARFPAYGIPALEMASRLNNIFETYENSKLKQAAVTKAQEMTSNYLGVNALSKGQKKSLTQEIDEIGAETVLGEDKDQVLESKNLPFARPQVQFFFAHEAAIAINHTMDPEKIPQRTADNMKALREFAEKAYPHLTDQVSYNVDVPWSEHKPHAKVIREYLAHLLRESDNEAITETLAILEKLGENHGGESGAQRAAEYAAIHPIVFGDRMNIPYVRYLKGVTGNPKINITIGGETERHFCAEREYLTDTATPEGLVDFIDLKSESTTDEQELEVLQRTKQKVERWNRIVTAQRARKKRLNPDLPEVGISLITRVAKTPTYYKTEYDPVHGEDISSAIELLEGKELELQQMRGADAALQRERLGGILFDLRLQQSKLPA